MAVTLHLNNGLNYMQKTQIVVKRLRGVRRLGSISANLSTYTRNTPVAAMTKQISVARSTQVA